MNIFYIAFLLLLSIPSTSFGIFLSKLALHNKTEQTVYFSPYHQQEFPRFKAKQSAETVAIKSGESVEVEKPTMKLLYTRVGLVSFNKSLLQESLTHREYVNLEHFSIGVTAGEAFIIKSFNDQPYVDSAFNKATGKMKKAFSKTVRKKSNTRDSSIQVRLSNDICDQEKAFIQKREKRVKKALKKIIGPVSGDNIPHVAIMGSGGGYRALIGYWAALDALNKIGIWNTCMYASGVSGSTWLLSALYGSEKSLDTFTDYLQPRLKKNLLKQNIYKTHTMRKLLHRKPDFTMVDIWGMLISKALLDVDSSMGLNTKLSNIAPFIDNGSMPLYICTAVHRGMKEVKWFEYTPYEVGSQDYEAYIPARYAGARFNKGICIEPSFKEYPLGLHCGVFGSAFAMDAQRAAAEIDNKFLDLVVMKTRLSGVQLSTGSLTNFMKGIETTGMGKSEYLKLVDSAYEINIPMPPCIRRKPDIIIVINLPETIKKDEAGVLRKAIEDAKKRGYSMPEYNPEGIHDSPITVLRPEPGSDAPVIIYLPNIHKTYPTTKLAYNKKEFNSLYKPMKKGIIDSKDIIYDVYKEVWNRKNSRSENINEEVFEEIADELIAEAA